MKIREAQGHLFELAFNAGILTAIHQSGMKYAHMGLFIDDLKRINHRGIVNKLVEMKLIEGFIDAESQRIWAAWGKLLLLRGHLGGLGLWKELMDTFGYSPASSRNWELLYMQCCLSDVTSMRTLEKSERERYSQILSQFGIAADQVTPYINKYADTGEFLKADTLMLMSKDGCKNKEYHIVCVDLSAFTVESNQNSEFNSQKDNDGSRDEQEQFDLWNLSSASSLLGFLKVELRHLMSKSVYHKLKIDTRKGSNQELIIGQYIKDYLTAFSYYDKDFVKLVQAASYSASFVKFLESENIIPKDATVQVTALGYTTRGISTLNVGREDFHILELCADAYKSMKRQEKSDRENSIDTYERTLSKMLNLIKKNAVCSLSRSLRRVGVLENEESVEKYYPDSNSNEQNVKEFVDSLCDIDVADKTVCFSETVTNFNNPSDLLDKSITSKYHLLKQILLKDAHAKIIQEQLLGNCRYLLLTGNPGIGKTTAVVKFIRDRADEGFLLFYVSPRLSVNEDTINKFKDKSGHLFADDLYCIYTSRAIIFGNNDQPTVRYYSNCNNKNFERPGVTFFGAGDDEKRITTRRKQISRLSSNSLCYDRQSGTGVIRSLCDAGHALMKEGVNKIVITCSTQSLRKVNRGGDSLDNFQRLFRSVTNNGQVIPERMIELSSRLRNIIVMIDEVTGDNAGVEWFHSMKKWLGTKLELFDTSHGFNTKLIIADASLTGVDVVKPHLGTREAEPDKIYCSSVSNDQEPLEVSFQSFTDESKLRGIIDSAIINVNSYPAGLIELTYQVFFEVSKINDDGSIKNKPGRSVRDESLVTEIIHHVNHPDLGQLLVYIQDKQRLRQLISLVKKRLSRFDQNKTYLEIHSQMPDGNKETLLECRNQVRVVFMTSSAARGISFPHARHIIVELPRFQIENNLMEIIQVIYRGRGEFGEGQNNDRAHKKVTVYIVEKVFTNAPKNQQSKITRAANLIGSLLVLRTAIMTRIVGAGYLGGRNIAMIPIGGKAMYSSGETFSTRIKSLMQLLRSHQRLHPDDQDVKLVLEHLPPFFKSSEFLVQKPPRSSNSPVPHKQMRKKISLLSLLESGVDFLFDQCSCMADLLEIEISPQVYMDGSLLIVPMNNHTVTSCYSIDPYSQIRSHITPNFINALNNISRGNYSENIKNEISFAIDFIDHLSQNEGNTQQISDYSNFSDQYFAVPLHFLVADETLKRSFTGDENFSVSQDFRMLLERYVKALYPANDFLPIGDGFVDFPWVIFKSYDLAQIRRSLFSANYFLNSRSLNLLNLILSRQ